MNRRFGAGSGLYDNFRCLFLHTNNLQLPKHPLVEDFVKIKSAKTDKIKQPSVG